MLLMVTFPFKTTILRANWNASLSFISASAVQTVRQHALQKWIKSVLWGSTHRDDCHDAQSSKGAHKDQPLGLLERQQQSYEECLVPQL